MQYRSILCVYHSHFLTKITLGACDAFGLTLALLFAGALTGSSSELLIKLQDAKPKG